MKRFYFFVGLWVAFVSVNAQNVADFENIQLDSASYWNGSDGTGTFESGGFSFPNSYNADWASWNGFSVSNMKDTVTPGYENQYSAITAGGFDGSANYAVSWIATTVEMFFETPAALNGFYVTNATYAYLSMKNGDAFSKKFGGVDETDPDYFKLIIMGKDNDGNELDSVEFLLADFRFEASNEDYILDHWEWIDLTSLGTVSRLEFKLESTDVGDWGMNTPAYFCMDNFTGTKTVEAHGIAKNDLRVYPNPVKDMFYVESADVISEMFLTDNTGKIIQYQQIPNKNKLRISGLSAFSSGIYYIKLKTNKGVLFRKVLKI